VSVTSTGAAFLLSRTPFWTTVSSGATPFASMIARIVATSSGRLGFLLGFSGLNRSPLDLQW